MMPRRTGGTKRLLPSLLAPLLLGACTQVHNPELGDLRVPAKSIHNFVPRRPVTLTNGADPNLGNQRLAEAGYEAVEGDLWKWTESAVDLTRREIEARGGNATDGGENELILQVSGIDIEQGQWNLRGTVHLQVEYGGSLIKTFTANVGTSRGSAVALDAALRIVVGDMLSDPEIQRFL